MTLKLFTLVPTVLVGAVVGLVAVRFAPDACKQFHQFSVSKRSIPLHVLSLAFFAAGGALGVWQHDIFMAAGGFGLAIVALLALAVVIRNKNMVSADHGSNGHN